jgi:hypothetical protein
MGCGGTTGFIWQDRDQWRTPANAVMNFRLRRMLENSWVAAELATSQEELSSIDLDPERVKVQSLYIVLTRALLKHLTKAVWVVV